jgi:hypothetical protein
VSKETKVVSETKETKVLRETKVVLVLKVMLGRLDLKVVLDKKGKRVQMHWVRQLTNFQLVDSNLILIIVYYTSRVVHLLV